MAPKSRKPTTTTSGFSTKTIPRPFRPAPEALSSFTATLSERHIYLAHIDAHPAAFKRKIFLVPVALNLTVVVAFLYRIYTIGPWYLSLLTSFLGDRNYTTVVAAETEARTLAWTILARTVTFALDAALAVFVWPWPWEFVFGSAVEGSPIAWRWNVGFRDKEVVVRCSREWDRSVLQQGSGSNKNMRGGPKRGARMDFLKPEGEGAIARGEIVNRVRSAMGPKLTKEKTGYLTMNGEWDLCWVGMVHAMRLVDKKEVALEAFTAVALVHHELHGWLCMDLDGSAMGGSRLEQQRRNDVFKFRSALAAVGKEDLFFRWVEVVQFESTRPEGFGKERQEVVAEQIRNMFKEQGIDFDDLWREAVGRESADGI